MIGKRKMPIKNYVESSSDEESKPIRSTKAKNVATEESGGVEELSAYEKLRLKNIEEREQLLKSLGIDDALKELHELLPPTIPVKRKPSAPRLKIAREPLPPREPSRRIRKLAAKSSVKIMKEVEKELEEEEEKDERFQGSIPMKAENDESEEFMKTLKDINTDITYNPDIDLKSCDLNCFQKCMVSLQMAADPTRLVPKRIQSLHVHPTTSKRLIIAGDTSGRLGLWDLEAGMESIVATFQAHHGPLNCISVSKTDSTKVFTTGHDGAFICADLEHNIFSNVYATNFHMRIRHLTWHDQLDDNRILLAHGNGKVGIIDTRGPNTDSTWIPCFERSARTVQHHPSKDNYFLVSSGAGFSCNVYDIRACSGTKADPISEMIHPKGLTSAFFSPSGDYVLSTCNDDHLRLYSSPLQSKYKLDKQIPHNNHTGRWLSVFKATWHPARNDVFLIGSLLSPRRIQMYGTNGKLVAELKHTEMVSISPVISAHPTVPFIVGGNSSGRVHAFNLKSEVY